MNPEDLTQINNQNFAGNPNANYNYGSAPITSATLNPGATLDYQTPNPTPVYNPAGLDSSMPELEMTAPEKQADDLSTRLMGLNERLVGESSYRAEQEAAKGIPQLETTEKDLTSQLTALKNEYMAIPLSLQEQSKGRGITEGGLAPIQAGELRKNAIRSLGVSTLLEASRGNLSLAMQQVDRAVAQRFDPIREEINAKLANLDLILKSPAYSLADKNRAQKQLQLQQEKERLIARQEENYKTAQAMAAAAVKLNPNNQAALMAAQEAQNLSPEDPQYLQKAFQLLGQFQADPAQIQRDLDAHLLNQAELSKAHLDISMAPLDMEYKKAQIAGQKASTAATYQNIAESKAQMAKINAEIQAMKNPTALVNDQGKPLNDTQNTALGYAQRIAEAEVIISEMGSKFTGKANYLTQYAPNALKSEDRQKFEQAQRNFINAVLRKESGAAISPSEFENARKQYFPQPGDTSGVLQSKTQNRNTIYTNFLRNAGNPNLATGIETQVKAKGYDYNKMKADGLSDEEIKKALGI